MNLLQPLLFSLQASTDQQTPVILPELLTNPFFKPTELAHPYGICPTDYLLTNGCIRLQVPIDYIIQELLQSHSCKGPGAAQAEKLINSTFSVSKYSSTPGTLHYVRMKYENAPPLIVVNYVTSETRTRSSSQLSEHDEGDILTELPGQKLSKGSLTTEDSGCSSLRSSSIDMEGMDGHYRTPISTLHQSLSRTTSLQPNRRISVIDRPSITARSPSPGSLMGGGSEFKFTPDATRWHCSVQDNMVVGAYGDNTYSLLTWNPDLKAKILLSSSAHPSVHTAPSSPIIVDSKHPVLTIYIKNTTQNSIAFSIRANRQSKMFTSHIIYPKEGLQLLSPGEEWKRAMDVVQKDSERDEHFVIDVLLCTLEAGSSAWNLCREYAILKASTE